MPKEIPQTEFSTIKEYDRVIKWHICKMYAIHTKSFKTNKNYQESTKHYTDTARIGKKPVEQFCIKDLVWINIERRLMGKVIEGLQE